MATGYNQPVVVTGLFFGQSEQLVSPSFASLGDFLPNTRSRKSGISLFSLAFPQFFHSPRTMTSNRVTWLSIGATVTLSLWAGWMLASETRYLVTQCKLGPEPAACELRLLGR